MDKKGVSIESVSDIYTHYRINPKTGSEVAGRYIWTPNDESVEGFDDVLVCNPAPTELLAPLDEELSEYRTQAAVGQLVEPTIDYVKELDSSSVGILSLNNVGSRYYNGCTCGGRYDNNCAHFLSNAFILAGYRDLLTSSIITARCSHGRPIRAQDMLRWFQAKNTGFHGGRIQRNSGWWATYQETRGAQHVVVIDANNWVHYGTGDYHTWPTQWNYRIA
ncbi:hypothetical protein ACIGKM_05565 [Ectopseudomonas toyotomiensis]|uniref:hypothetical protein n=1 Tax=Ectopseudomonas toyotomiensis TaxID=554344 RepID=UPI0037CC9A68